MDCSKLTNGLIAAECNKTAKAGLEDDLLLINYDDIDREKSKVVDGVITSIVLKQGKKGFPFSTFGKSFNDAGGDFVAGTYRNFWSQKIPLRIFTKDEESKKFANELTGGAKLVPVVRNKEGGVSGEVKYEVYGWDNGLELTSGTFTVAMADGVVYDLMISSTDAAQESTLPKSVFATDLAATELMLQSLGLVTRALMNNQGAVIQNGEGRAITVNSEK